MADEVYRNLRTGTWSVRGTVFRDGKYRQVVTDHPYGVVLQDATFVVQPAGNRRVRQEGRKNVHAFVRGERSHMSIQDRGNLMVHMRKATYNPYQNTAFVDSETGEEIFKADLVIMDIDKGVFYANEEEAEG